MLLILFTSLLRYRVSLHERYQDVCFYIVFVLTMYSFHTTALPTTMRQVRLSVPLAHLLLWRRDHMNLFWRLTRTWRLTTNCFILFFFIMLAQKNTCSIVLYQISLFVILSSLWEGSQAETKHWTISSVIVFVSALLLFSSVSIMFLRSFPKDVVARL